MNKSELSILQQKAAGTFDRNEYIRYLNGQGLNYAQIARKFNLTRQSVRRICNETGNHKKDS